MRYVAMYVVAVYVALGIVVLLYCCVVVLLFGVLHKTYKYL